MTQNVRLKKLVRCSLLCAIAIILVYAIHFPIFPSAPFLEYDMADVPIFIGTLAYGPLVGLLMTVVVSVLQGVLVSSASGWVGIVMHTIATGTFVIIAGAIGYRKETAITIQSDSGENEVKIIKTPIWRSIVGFVCGSICMILMMLPLNMVFSSFFYVGCPLGVAFSETLKIMISIPSGIWGIITVVVSLAAGLGMGWLVYSGRGDRLAKNKIWCIISSVLCGLLATLLVLTAFNLVFLDAGLLPQQMQVVYGMLITAMAPFNAIKSVANAVLAFIIYRALRRFIAL